MNFYTFRTGTAVYATPAASANEARQIIKEQHGVDLSDVKTVWGKYHDVIVIRIAEEATDDSNE